MLTGLWTAIIQLWDWGWTYSGLSINNCGTGIDITAGGSSAITTGSITLIDSSMTNVPIGIKTAWTSSSSPATAGSMVLENIALSNVPIAVQGPSGTVLTGSTGSVTITGWGEGHSYTPSGPTQFQGTVTPNSRPSSLLSGSKYYTRSKPQYQSLSASDFLSVRTAGCRGDGTYDDVSFLLRRQGMLLANELRLPISKLLSTNPHQRARSCTSTTAFIESLPPLQFPQAQCWSGNRTRVSWIYTISNMEATY